MTESENGPATWGRPYAELLRAELSHRDTAAGRNGHPRTAGASIHIYAHVPECYDIDISGDRVTFGRLTVPAPVALEVFALLARTRPAKDGDA